MAIFAHMAIFALTIYGFLTVAEDEKQNKEPILVSIVVGIILLILFTGFWGMLTAAATIAIALATSRK